MNICKSTGRVAATICLCIATAFTTPALAYTQADAARTEAFDIVLANAATDNGAGARINLSGKLRMLSQKAVAAACYVQTGTSIQESTAVLEATISEFNTIIDALEFGNAELGIPTAEDRRRTLAGLAKLRELWQPAATFAGVIAAGNGTPDDLASLAAQSADVLDIAIRLVSEINGQYGNPNAIRRADAMLIDISGRQRMLAQRISKNACLLASGAPADGVSEELVAATDMFTSTHAALASGMPELGIPAPATSEISEGLAVVAQRWDTLSPILSTLRESGSMDAAQHERMFTGANALTGEMNSVVVLVAQSAEF